jgi:Flp pilus assembly protein TadD
MKRKSLLAVTVSLMVLITLTTPHFGGVGAWGKPASAGEAPAPASFSIGKFFRAIFGGHKKKNTEKNTEKNSEKNTAAKITNKDIKKFESTQVTRVSDANNSPVRPSSPANNVVDDRPLAERIQRGRELLNANQLNEAITELTTAAALDPKSGEVHMLLGVAFDRKGLGARAREAFEIAARDPNDQAMHLNNLGFLLYRQGENDDAIKYLKKAAKLSPDDSRIWNNLALVQLAAEKYDDAYKSSVHALGEFDSRIKIADRLQARGRMKDAIEYLEKARMIRADSADLLVRLESLYYYSGQEEKSLRARQALASLVASTANKK